MIFSKPPNIIATNISRFTVDVWLVFRSIVFLQFNWKYLFGGHIHIFKMFSFLDNKFDSITIGVNYPPVVKSCL